MNGIDLNGSMDLKEVMYQILKSDPQLIQKLKEIFEMTASIEN